MREGRPVGCGVKRSEFHAVVLNFRNLFLPSAIFYLNIINVQVTTVKYCREGRTVVNKVQSHPNSTRDNRRLSLAGLPGRPAASRGVKLPLLPNTRSVFQSL